MAEHSLKLAERRKLELTGVNNVNSFDEEEIVLETGLGHLCVLGQELHIIMLNLDEGKVAIEGNITSLEYKNQGPDIKTRGKNILSRLLK
ncbi:MAG: sporulation protein YabP [Syntrophomonadaceae bacterium]|nr:sporulation protein YabP [Syntrophomonadaceae bacterium]